MSRIPDAPTSAPSGTGPGEGNGTPAAASSAPSESKPGWVRRMWPYLIRQRRNLEIALGGAIVGSVAQVDRARSIERQIVDNVIVQPPSPLAPWLVAAASASAS